MNQPPKHAERQEGYVRTSFLVCSIYFSLTLLATTLNAQRFQPNEIALWKKQASNVTITRDQWGIAHIKGRSDGDAVFGLLYAQCEDDFPRIEMNYINAMGRLAEVEGEDRLYDDLRTRLFYDTIQAEAYFKNSEPWLKDLCSAFADGINYYLHTHPGVKPLLINRFKPWMPFLFSEGSIGTDIEKIPAKWLKAFYEKSNPTALEDESMHEEEEPRGSNGFAIAPSRSESGKALLLINPHTSFYFRPEIHVASDQGLNAYGAVTWGQFFIYQGFNEFCGWMHTSSQADAVDEYSETVEQRGGQWQYQYAGQWMNMKTKQITLAYKEGNARKKKTFIAYYTGHGPVIGKVGDRWVSIKLMVEPLKALTQSFQRTKAKGYNDYQKIMALRANSSNNTVFADREGNIAYWHGNFIPKRDTAYLWNATVDGSTAATEWLGLHAIEDLIHILNPPGGWIQNCNSTPFTAAGANSPSPKSYPAYMAPDKENARGLNAVKVLARESRFDLDKLIVAAYDPYLAGFERLVPAFVKAIDATPNANESLREVATIWNSWDKKSSAQSIATTLAILSATKLRENMVNLPNGLGQIEVIEWLISKSDHNEKISALQSSMATLTTHFGTWRVPWGDVNRYQRLTGKINEVYDDKRPSLPIPFASSFWGSLAAYGSKPYPNTFKWYGNVGNSFVAVVEFGERIRAKSLLAGGVSNDPKSPYFFNQAERYAKAQFKDVLFYENDIRRNAVRTYHPGK
jgi:acyl-homoserine lactone acylase PvdQ